MAQDFRAERGKVVARGGYLPDGRFALGSGGETRLGLREAWRLRGALVREQGAADPLPGVIARAAAQRLAFWRR